MCGIFGHIGSSKSYEKCIEGLKFLEYRGYDSAGIAGIEAGNLVCYKEKGKIADLENALGNKIHQFESAIGHTRWATHGKASKHNAHPHLDQSGEIAIVHNGILENHRSLRLMLEQAGTVFQSETDSEVIAQLIAHFYDVDLIAAVRKATSLMKGFWGLAILHKDHPDEIVATKCENPIVVGISKENQEAYVSSDPYAFKDGDLDLYFLENHQIALIDRNRVTLYDFNDQEIEAVPERIDLEQFEADKGAFDHYMLKEIHEQPSSISSSFHGRILMEEGNAAFEDFKLSKSDLEKVDQVLILGCGTSWHAGLIASQQIQQLSGIPTRAEIASEFRYQQITTNPRTLVVVISQSGETFDTIAAMRKAKHDGAQILAICNVPASTLMREADQTILLRAGPEISVCSTKAFTSQLTVLSLFALKLGRLKGYSLELGRQFLSEILSLPQLIEAVIENQEAIEAVAAQTAHRARFLFIGRQYMYPTCLEAALKLKEISYTNATGYPAGELKHGPIALIDTDSVVVALLGNQMTYEKMLSNLEEVKARDGIVIAFAPQGSEEVKQVADVVIELPMISDSLSSLPYAVATQLFAYFIAKKLGTEIDQPRNLAKSVTVE